MVPAGEEYFEAVPVSNLVNKVANTSPEIQKPVGEPLSAVEAPPKATGSGQMSLF